MKTLTRFIGKYVVLVILVALIAGFFLFLTIASLSLTIIVVYAGFDLPFWIIAGQMGLWVIATFFLCLFYGALDSKKDYDEVEKGWKTIDRGRPI